MAKSKLNVVDLLEACGGDVASLKSHTATLLASGELDAESEGMAQVTAGAFSGAEAVVLKKLLSEELLALAKPEAAQISKAWAEAVKQ